VVIAVASLTYRMVEDPGRRYFNDLAKKIDGKVDSQESAVGMK
jgi:hypothetical protein